MKFLRIQYAAVVVMCLSSCSSPPKRSNELDPSTILELLGPSTHPQTNNAQLSVFNLLSERLAPLYDFRLMSSGVADVVYTCYSFGMRNDRWPTNYAELSEFVEQSNGYLFLAKHKDMVLKPLTNGALEIHYAGLQSTNDMKITLGKWTKTN